MFSEFGRESRGKVEGNNNQASCVRCSGVECNRRHVSPKLGCRIQNMGMYGVLDRGICRRIVRDSNVKSEVKDENNSNNICKAMGKKGFDEGVAQSGI